MRIAVLLLIGAACGSLLTALWMGGEDRTATRPVSDPAEDPEASPELAQTPELSPSPRPAAPAEAPGGSATQPASDPVRARDLGAVVKRIQESFAERDRLQQQQIRSMKEKLERLEATAPDPEILNDLRSASLEDLEGLMRETQALASERLLTPSERVLAPYAGVLASEGGGAARLLPRGKFDKLIEQRGGGAYWSFKTKSNSYDDEPDLSLEHGRYRSGFYGGSKSWFLDLGDVAVGAVEADPDRPPRSLDEDGVRRWNWMWQEAEAESERRPDRRRMPGENPGAEKGRIQAVENHTFLLRAILPGEHDLLVAFRAVESGERGQTLVYRILREFEMPSRR